jgi:two-component system OmpR family sensor kinase
MWFRGTDRTAPSLRRRLLWLVLAAIAAASVVQGISAYRTALRNADALFDLQLQQLAHSIDAGVPLLPGEAQVFEFSVQVWGPGGARLFRSQGIELPQPSVLGFSDLQVAGTDYRVYRLDTGRRTIQVAQDLDARKARARGLAVRAVLPVLLLAPLLMAAVWLLIASSLAPVERMRRQLAARPAEDFSPLPEAGLPAEVQPLVRELNALFRRVDAAFASQRHFVADAAHELRSPLAALKLQAQALRGLPPGEEQELALRRLDAGIERAIALLSQLLQLARADSDGSAGRRCVDLQEVCREAIGEVLPQAHRKGIDLGMQTPDEAAAVQGDAESLRMLVRNLVDNAVKFAPAGGRVDVSLLRQDAGITLRVEDSGPGIPEADRERVFDRFHRAAAADTPGSGLGLAIVQAVARRHGAQVRLGRSERLGGLRADVLFPRGLSEA